MEELKHSTDYRKKKKIEKITENLIKMKPRRSENKDDERWLLYYL